MQTEQTEQKEKSDKIEGEPKASRKDIPPVSSSGAPTQMDVDPAPGTTTPQLVQDDKSAEPMAREETIPPVVTQAIEEEVVVPSADKMQEKKRP